MSTISDPSPIGNGEVPLPLICLFADGQIDFPPETFRESHYKDEFLQLCLAGPPIFVIESLLSWGENDRLTIQCLIAAIPNARVKAAESLPDAPDLLDAVLAIMVGDADVERCGRGKRAAIEAAALIHARNVQPAASKIATRLHELRVNGEDVRRIRRDIQELVDRLRRIANPDQRQLLRVSDVLPDAPVPPAAIVPRPWQLDAAGTSRQDAQEPFMPVPVVIRRRLLDIDDGDESVEIAWPRDGQWKTTVVSRATIAAPGSIVELANRGLPVTNNNAKDVIDYLHDFESQNIELLPVGRVTGRLGWVGPIGQQGFLWGQTFLGGGDGPPNGDGAITFAADGGVQQIADGYYDAGTFENWRRTILALNDYPRVRLCMLAALSPPLLRILGGENFILSLAGPTSRGKTTALRACASLWGCPSESATTYGGLSPCTIRNWMKWGRHRRSAELAEFYKRVMQARAMAEVADLEKIKAATDWKATAWHMERRNPKAWGRKRVITIHTGTQRRKRSREEIEREMDAILGYDHASAGG